jgi:2'-5' RNA ligase
MRDRTALVVEVPEAEPGIGRWREQHDPTAVLGMPAHVTVLYPLGSYGAVRTAAAELCAAQQPFDFALDRIETFPGEIVWLHPAPDAPFHDLIAAATARFPEWPPYEGTIDEPTPHLTVAYCTASTFEQVLGEVRADVEPQLPIAAHATAATLFGATDDGRWVALERLPFGTPR